MSTPSKRIFAKLRDDDGIELRDFLPSRARHPMTGFEVDAAPPDVLDRALQLQRDLANHHGMWHRAPIPDLLITETAMHHQLGVVHIDGDFDRIAEIRPLTSRRLSGALPTWSRRRRRSRVPGVPRHRRPVAGHTNPAASAGRDRTEQD